VINVYDIIASDLSERTPRIDPWKGHVLSTRRTAGGLKEMGENKDTQEMDFSENYAKAAARVLESISRTAQLSSLATPEIQEMFENWLEILSHQILRSQEIPGRLDIPSKAEEIGISSSSLLGLLLYLQRQGRISITEIQLESGCGLDEDICDCFRER
jgi:hypothetical protein